MPETVQTPKKKKKWIIIGVASLLIIAAGINIGIMKSSNKAKTPVDVKFAEVTERNLSNTKLISGQVKPGNIERYYIDPSKGTVKEIFVKGGQEVKKGAPLFRYDTEEINLQIKQAELDQKIISINYGKNKKKLDALKKEMKTAINNSAGKEVLEPLEAQVSELEMQLKTTELEKEKGSLRMDELKRKMGQFTVHSRFDGVVQNLNTSQGSSQEIGGSAKPFLQMVSKEPLQVQGTLTELQKSQIREGQIFIATAKTAPEKTWTGKIIEVSDNPISEEMGTGLTSPETGKQTMSSYTYKAALDTQNDLSPGFHVSLQVQLETKKGLTVPRSSVVELNHEAFVYVEEKGKLRKQMIKTGSSDKDSIEVLEGLAAGQKVVEHPSNNTYDGMEVQVK
ncbi:efflux RND transporter periplasmic adaptor subunit [Paenibacillus larvae]|uniref:Efflux transporter, RND family, MFP subunit n=3 Tax=Paenibacillus larvae TaxID=1464 RepID=V9WF11_9BACL|nr:efflux RND transporter periplasmic adaptor subunit [Paenibacillus larvae]AHD07712.1 efflux transporter, RND family, MFP subunit [Paenibacillus larvae subsp. larvae DSM 25430]AVF24142.1 efflux transporter, RND family, MFP subunit [Paenibacillus larvae subsp. larvae]AVG14273.1 efflux transporter, RND family, MFP subunit [Paenibacillus larvae subsp. larvae DSM 25430]ETK28980.1 efflux transporter, RND family, MFP subunit [Paenibacillus larvae subsp. larvae DSM 25719]MCY7478505.1 efflux RND tran